VIYGNKKVKVNILCHYALNIDRKRIKINLACRRYAIAIVLLRTYDANQYHESNGYQYYVPKGHILTLIFHRKKSVIILIVRVLQKAYFYCGVK